MATVDQLPSLPPDMGPQGFAQQTPDFPMGDRTMILQMAMQAERLLMQMAPLSPSLGQIINAFVPAMRRALVQSMPGNMGPSSNPQADLLGGGGGGTGMGPLA